MNDSPPGSRRPRRLRRQRAEFLSFWTDLLLSGAPSLEKAGKVDAETVAGMKAQLDRVGHDPDAVFCCSFVERERA